MSDLTYHVDEDETISESVVHALAAATDTPAQSLQPLYDSVNPDALDLIFEGDRTGCIVFSHAGHRITVRGSGKIAVERVE